MEIDHEKLRELQDYISEEKWDYAGRLIDTFAVQHFSLHDHRVNMWVHYLAGVTFLQTGHPVKALIHLGTFHNLTNNTTETNVYSKVHNVRAPTLEEVDRCESLLEQARTRARAILASDAELKGDPQRIEKKMRDFENCFINPAGKTSGCFVATACCGNVTAPEVIVLSTFRDVVMMKQKVGQLAVQIYYWVSPILARTIAASHGARQVCLLLIVKPAARCAKMVMSVSDLSSKAG